MIGNRSEFKVLNTTPLQPASNDLATISALLETGEDESKKGFLNFNPQKSIAKSTLLVTIIPPYKRFRGSEVLVVMVSGRRLLVSGYQLLSPGNWSNAHSHLFLASDKRPVTRDSFFSSP
jgi:hypothetical protein